ncbi:Uu.00g094130.m01.CDS01 [Anthostomella pinea]|uniref:Elongator complex protein 5 n=1 Tax=Anthostomella pinea TaxID=933095 RepID=A0AAI8VP92_9PEZI|nr:Uu.00g094130.m01.CDS01 [Anthostomella pinea]
MPSSAQSQHARSHALLLLQKLLNLRDSASPLTLVLDTLEQSAKPVIREFMGRAKVGSSQSLPTYTPRVMVIASYVGMKRCVILCSSEISKTQVIFVSFATLRKPADADIFVKARGKSPEALRAEIASHYPAGAAVKAHKTLIILDTLTPLASTTPSTLPLFLSSLITSTSISLVATYHTDVPLTQPRSSSTSSSSSSSPFGFSEYEPHPLTTLLHLATAVLRTSSLCQTIERHRVRNRSLAEPGWGLAEGREGVLVGLGGERKREVGSGGALVVEMELRRRSGRAVAEKFVLVPSSSRTTTSTTSTPSEKKKTETSRLYLLADHPAFRKDPSEAESGVADQGEEQGAETTFNLGLTEKQRRDREGIMLPYFDAQSDIGAGEGGRILYEMGREDDFDDEEDEI